MARKISLVLIAALAASMMIAGCGKKKAETRSTEQIREEKGYPVEVIRVARKDLARKVHFTGTLRLPDTVNVVPQAGGIVKKIYADKGAKVSPGSPLLMIEQTDYRNNVAQAEAAAQMAKVQLEVALKQRDAKDWTMASNMADAAKAAYEFDRWNVDRMKTLKDAGLVSEQQLIGAETKALASKKQMDNANIQTEMADESTKALQVQAARAQLKQAEAMLSMAKTALERTVVRSEVSGVVSLKLTTVGSLVGPSEAVFQIITSGDKKVAFTVNENELPKVTKGQKVKFSSTALQGREFEAVVTFVASFVLDMNREAIIEAELIGEAGDLKDGMFVEGDIELTPENLLVIPYTSILENEFVWTVGPKKTPVKKFCRNFDRVGDYLSIKDDCVSEGDRLIAKGHNLIAAGKKLKILSETSDY